MKNLNCKICKKQITTGSKSGLCASCSLKGKKKKPFTEQHKQNIGKANKNKKRSKKTKENISKSLLGKKKSKEHKRNISKGKTGKKLSKKTCKKMSKSCKGKKLSKKTRDKISRKATQRTGKLSSGYKHGSYCKDKKYYCQECGKEICADSKSGLCASCCRVGIKRGPMSEETKRKLSKSKIGKKVSEEIRKKISLGRGGTGIPYENCDLALSLRLLHKYINWRTKVFKRDNFTCQECEEKGGNLEAHHITKFSIIFKEFLNKYNQYSPIDDKETLLELAINYKDFWNIDNGQTLCKKCHRLTDKKI